MNKTIGDLRIGDKLYSVVRTDVLPYVKINEIDVISLEQSTFNRNNICINNYFSGNKQDTSVRNCVLTKLEATKLFDIELAKIVKSKKEAIVEFKNRIADLEAFVSNYEVDESY